MKYFTTIRKHVKMVCPDARVVHDGPYSLSATVHTKSVKDARQIAEWLDGNWVVGNGVVSAGFYRLP